MTDPTPELAEVLQQRDAALEDAASAHADLALAFVAWTQVLQVAAGFHERLASSAAELDRLRRMREAIGGRFGDAAEVVAAAFEAARPRPGDGSSVPPMGEGLQAKLAQLADDTATMTPPEMRPGRWWRAVGPDGRLWCESSSESEVRERARPGDRVERLHTWSTSEWRPAPDKI